MIKLIIVTAIFIVLLAIGATVQDIALALEKKQQRKERDKLREEHRRQAAKDMAEMAVYASLYGGINDGE